MKKNIGNYKLNRDTTSRKALFKSLIQSLILRESVETTQAKAMAVRPLFEKMLTKAKSATVHEIRQIQGVLQNSLLIKKLVKDIAPRYKDVKGGYTRITPIGARRGDNAKIVKLSLTKTSVPKVETPSATPQPVVEAKKEVVEKVKTLKPKTSLPKEKQLKTVKLAPSRAGRRGDK